jgi:hypothetical protein
VRRAGGTPLDAGRGGAMTPFAGSPHDRQE